MAGYPDVGSTSRKESKRYLHAITIGNTPSTSFACQASSDSLIGTAHYLTLPFSYMSLTNSQQTNEGSYAKEQRPKDPTPNDMATIPPSLSPHLTKPPNDTRPIIVMTCGIAGAGKSTLSKLITSTYPTFTRISIDNIIHSHHGMYGIDYPTSKHTEYSLEADDEYDQTLNSLLDERRDIMLDRAFYVKQDRDDVKQLIERKGGRWVLVYLQASKEVLWRRIQERRAQARDADSAFDVTAEILGAYCEGFEEPKGEGEIIVAVV